MKVLAIEWRKCSCRPKYSVSSDGQIRNDQSGTILRPWSHRSGHLYVSLGRGFRRQVHRLVIEAFGHPERPGVECRHLDGDPTNNHVSNLAWGTRKQNIEDLKETSGRYAKAHLSDDMALHIKRACFGRPRGTQSRVAEELGLSISMVNRICRGVTYAHIGD